MKISIIIPVYNVEKYISKCLSSIFDQQLDEDFFEIIAVNDGTPDNSISIVEKFSNEHDNIHIINQRNQGVSAARNTGINNANGDFLVFLDADDWLGIDSLKLLHKHLMKFNNIDMCICNMLLENDCAMYDWRNILKENSVYTGVELFNKYKYTRGSVTGCAFNRRFLLEKKITFPVGIRNAEDSLFFTYCQVFASQICCYNINLYFVFDRPGSAKNSITNKNINSFLNVIERLECFQTENSLSKKALSLIEYKKYSTYSSMTREAILIGMSYRQMLLIKDFKKYMPIRMDLIPMKRASICMFNFSYKLFYYIMLFRLKL